MATDDPSGPRAAPVVLRIKLRYETIDALVERFAPNVGKSGLFLPTRSLRPVGSEVRFELRLADDTPALVGLGKVRAVREPDPAQPRAAFGMAIELMRVTRESREVILRMLERRRALGLGETALPIPDDLDASRRAEVESTGLRDVRTVTPVRGSPAPANPIVSAPAIVTPTESLLTSPRTRRSSGSFGRERESSPFAIAPLAAEPVKPRRRRLSEVMAAGRSAGRQAAEHAPDPLADEQVDVSRALARARQIAGSDVEGELAVLRDQAAAPIEITIEAASAELARKFGGEAVKRERDRSARWAPPPAVVTPPSPPPQMEMEPEPHLEPEPEPPVEVAPPVPAVAPAPEPVAQQEDALGADAERAPPQLIHDHSDPDEVGGAAIETRFPANALLPEDDDPPGEDVRDELDPELFELRQRPTLRDPEDFEEHTQSSDIAKFVANDLATHPMIGRADDEALAARLDAELAAADAESDEEFSGLIDRRELAHRAATAMPGFDEDDAALARIGEAEHEPDHDAEADAHEVDDLEILAEADADDADLLVADGEADSGRHVAPVLAAREPAPMPVAAPFAAVRAPRMPTFDFAGALDLGDDEDPEQADDHARAMSEVTALAPDEADPDELADALEPADDDSEPDAEYTLAAALEMSDDIELPDASEAPEISVIAPAPEPDPADYDLESALDSFDSLDVALDDLATPPPNDRSPRRPTTGRPHHVRAAASRPVRLPRAVSEDGVMIDFDDTDDNDE